MISWPELEKRVGNSLGPVLVVTLVAISAFLIGSDYQSKKDAPAQAVNETATSDSSVVSDIQQTISANQTPGVSETTVSSSTSEKININTANLADLDTLPGIGPKYAQAIIDYRNQNGLFVSIDDLEKVKGIGPKTVDKLRDLITI